MHLYISVINYSHLKYNNLLKEIQTKLTTGSNLYNTKAICLADTTLAQLATFSWSGASESS